MFSYMWFVFLFVVVVDAQAPTVPTGAICSYSTLFPEGCTSEACTADCNGKEMITAQAGDVCVIKPAKTEPSTAYYSADHNCSCGKIIDNHESHCSDYDAFPTPTQQDCTDICNEKAVYSGEDGKAYCTELQGGNPRPLQGACKEGYYCQCSTC